MRCHLSKVLSSKLWHMMSLDDITSSFITNMFYGTSMEIIIFIIYHIPYTIYHYPYPNSFNDILCQSMPADDMRWTEKGDLHI